MPSRIDCEETLLLRQLFKLEQLERLLQESGFIEPRKQNWLLDELKQPEFFFRLLVKAQNQLCHDAVLKQPSQTFSTEFGEPVHILNQTEARLFSYPYFKIEFEVFKAWLREVFRILAEVIWDGRPTPEQLRDARDRIIFPLIKIEESSFVETIRGDILRDCFEFRVQFSEDGLRAPEEDFNRMIAELGEKWQSHVEARVCEAEERTPVESKQVQVEVAAPSVATNRRKRSVDEPLDAESFHSYLRTRKKEHPKWTVREMCVQIDQLPNPGRTPPRKSWQAKSQNTTWVGNYDHADTNSSVKNFVSTVLSRKRPA